MALYTQYTYEKTWTLTSEKEALRVKDKVDSGVPLDSKVIESFEVLSKKLNILHKLSLCTCLDSNEYL